MFDKLMEIVREYVDVDMSTVTLESNFITDFGVDSFTLSDIACAVEDEFDVEISDRKVHELKTIGDIINYLEEETA